MRLIPFRHELAPISPFQRQMSRLFEDFFGDEHVTPAQWLPAVDVQETDSEVVVRAEIPGIDPSQVEVSVHDNVLTLKGEKADETKSDEGNWHRVERRYGAFSRTVVLPAEVDPEKAGAKAANGVLTIKLGKKPEAMQRTIDVQVK